MDFFKKNREGIPPTDYSNTLSAFHSASKDNPDERDVWRFEDAKKGFQVFGDIGSGKTSNSGRMTAMSFLKNGGIVLTGNVEEKSKWVELAKDSGRSDDLVIVKNENPGHRNKE